MAFHSHSLLTSSSPLLGMLVVALLVCAPPDRAHAQVSEPAAAWRTSNSTRTSPGCSSSTTAAPVSVTVRGQERSFIARVPDVYRGDRPHDLVVAFHGRTNPNTQVRGYFDLDEALPEAIILYPSATAADSGFRWSDPGDLPAELRDYALLDALLVAFGNAYCLDLGRVFVVGHSLGASFANSVACHRGGVVRAVASVAGGIEAQSCDGGTAALVIHHPEDRLVPLSDGMRVRDAFIAANGVDGAPTPSSEPELAELGCVRYGGEIADPVVWCLHDHAHTRRGRYYPHNWPAGVAPAIARFFADLP